MSITEVQARISTITSRLEMLVPRGRAQVDPLTADAFAASLDSASQSRATSATPVALTTSGLTGLNGLAGSGLSASALSTALGLGTDGTTGLPGLGTGSATGALAPTGGPGAPRGGGATRAGGPSGTDVVAAAREYLGVPYLWGGTDPARGLDCSGLVQRVFADLGVRVPRTVAEQRSAGTEVASLAQARPGDLLVFDSARSPSGRHIGIYVGEGRMLHAPRSGQDVQVSDVWSGVTTIRRVVPAEAAATAPASAAAATTAAATAAQASRPAWAADGDLDTLFTAAAQRYDLPAGLLQAVARQESGMRTDAVSPAGAQGLMQLMPGTARELGVDAMDPAQAIDGGARYLRQQLDTFGSLELALAAYNAGPGNVRRHGGIPPFAETRHYVETITTAMGRGRS